MRTLIAALLTTAALAVTACTPGGGSSDWSEHKGDVPFVVGDVDKGLALAAQNGRPPMYFFTADW